MVWGSGESTWSLSYSELSSNVHVPLQATLLPFHPKKQQTLDDCTTLLFLGLWCSKLHPRPLRSVCYSFQPFSELQSACLGRFTGQVAMVPFKRIHHEDGIVPRREVRVIWSDHIKAHVAEGPQQVACERTEQNIFRNMILIP